MDRIKTLKKPSAVLLVALGVTVLCSAPPAFAQAAPGVIESLSIEPIGDGNAAATLIMATSHRLSWNARWLPDGDFQLTLLASRTAEAVSELTLDMGLIAEARVSNSLIDGQPAITLQVSLRSPARVFPEAGPNRIELTFKARDPEPAEPEPAQTSDELSGEYRIGAGDLLEVAVFGLDDFDRAVRVLRDGSISLPLLGSLRVAGMTLQEAQNSVARVLTDRRLVNDPQVTFFVKEYVSRGVSVQGAVERPGIYQMIQQRSLLEMLGEAGGISGRENDRAGLQIFVIRKTPDGEQIRIEVDADQLVNHGRADLNIPLIPGDVVLVPFAQRYRVYVSGAVARPGPVDFLSSEGITVLQAITAAGGPTERGNIGNVKILRKLPDGSETRIAVNVKKIRKGAREDVRLERNDTVIVGEWFF